MKNDIPLEVMVTHLRARRATLAHELAEVEKRAAELRGAIQETTTLEHQITHGMVSKSRLTCE